MLHSSATGVPRRLLTRLQAHLDGMRRVGQHESMVRQLVAGDYPAVCQHLLQADALVRVNVKHPRDQVLRCRRNDVPVASAQRKLALADTCQDLVSRVVRTVCERSCPAHIQTLT